MIVRHDDRGYKVKATAPRAPCGQGTGFLILAHALRVVEMMMICLMADSEEVLLHASVGG